MWKKLVIVCLTIWIVHGQYYDDDLANLGQRISARVQAEVAPLQGLGQRIRDQVHETLRPMQVNLNNRLSELDGLGDKISQQVYEGLEPVRAMELNFKMRDGVGGVTIATHKPGGKQFIIKNYQAYTCDSSIDMNTGECSGQLTAFKITSDSPKSDFCYLQSYSQVNNEVCLSTGGTSIEAYNNEVSCRSLDNSPIIKLSLDDYKRLCSAVREETEYRYIPNLNDNRHVPIPNQNKYVRCENQKDNLCIFHENNGLLNMYSYRSNILYNGGPVVIRS